MSEIAMTTESALEIVEGLPAVVQAINHIRQSLLSTLPLELRVAEARVVANEAVIVFKSLELQIQALQQVIAREMESDAREDCVRLLETLQQLQKPTENLIELFHKTHPEMKKRWID